MLLAFLGAAAGACPADTQPLAAGVQLTLLLPVRPTQSFSAESLAALTPTTLTQRQTVTSNSSGASVRSVLYGGVLVRDLLAKAGFGAANDRTARTHWIEAVATDGYRAVFSWGELFNHPLGDQVLVAVAQDGRPLDGAAGPLALRSLSDLRPGPRRVRNLCALIAHGL